MLITIIAFIIVLGILVLVHEFGHFITAKLAGVKVLEFSIGFPPRIFSWKRGETKYVIGALPFGGYVQMLGEDSASKDPRAYNNATPGKRIIIGIAGVLMNIILAWVLLSIGFMIGMTPLATPSSQIGGTEIKPQIFVVQVEKDSVAEKAGIKVGDQLLGTSQSSFLDLSSVSNFTKTNAGQTVSLKIKGEDKSTTTKQVSLPSGKDAPLGVGLIDQGIVKVAWYKAPGAAIREAYEVVKYTFTFLGSFFRQLFTTASISNQVGGPVAIYNMSGSAARAGAVVFLQFIAMLSLNLALINILPFPALDGGRVLFTILEKIFGKRIVKEEVEGLIHTIGFALLILLMLAITYKDIVKLFHR
ncbi:hypothetical protein COT78_00830 [Candidatus Berkelbacteria bacterium CG10_big_fil_rev_8_21_14_0_10_43_13]|uniref:PDZ domain-containing protein n=1 Tax=Candidatus Berkelbacteria bacterium CG10_big_fil_rev_8_21_14_0_10_43_13 TaxID=1974514 RepID=A0A2H0W7E3_9BACT|nr:MAG: hypothetical protein COT78_00830 [Candidatus Berkelbacteria bacterium CG10_big_fil_rev_8_21_14_0_10_43_13]